MAYCPHWDVKPFFKGYKCSRFLSRFVCSVIVFDVTPIRLVTGLQGVPRITKHIGEAT